MTSIPVLLGDGPDRIPREWEIMPFRFLFGPRANLAILLVLFVLLVGLGCTLIGLATAYGATDPRSLEIYKLVGLCATVAGIIALLIRSQATANYLHASKHETLGALNRVELKTEEIKQQANRNVHAAGEQIRAAERDLLDLPKTREEWHLFFRAELQTAAKQICDEMLKAQKPNA